jgi:energy-coupling factor transporter ATP-binding protein EcfA2
MFFRVENLGPLRAAEVDLSKEMILLTGPNSTGKTYLAWSVYGLFRSPEAPKVFQTLVAELLASPRQELDPERIVAAWPSLLQAVAEHLANRLHLCFATERQSFSKVGVSIRSAPGEPAPGKQRRKTAMGRSGGFQFRLAMGPPIALQFHKTPNGEAADASMAVPSDPVAFAQIPAEAQTELTRQLEIRLAWLVLSSHWPDCTLLPTERTAVDMFARELSMRRTELVSRAVEAQLEIELSPNELTSITRDVGRYPWPIQDSLVAANDLVYLARLESEFADLASELEAFLGGAVAISREGAIGFKPAGGSATIGIHLTSSIVKSLVSLVFYLRHRARKGDLLMIDEPELNLHPDNQRKLARVLTKCVNRGLRLMMSTHSDYLLRELNNLIILSQDRGSLRAIREKHGYADSELLSPEKVGVYLFKDGTAVEVPVQEGGFEVQTIEDEINRLNALSQEIYVALDE